MRIGITEMLLVFAVALLVLGPDQLPVYAGKLGKAVREFKRCSGNLTEEIRENVVAPLEEAQKPLKEALEPFSEAERSVREDIEDVKKSINEIGKPEKKTRQEEETV